MTGFMAQNQVMNAPFKPPIIFDVHGQATVSVSRLKANPAAVVAEASQRPVAILSRNKAVAYVISPEIWDAACDAMEELRDIKLVQERLANPGETIEVSLED
jgi:antitoxin StbD